MSIWVIVAVVGWAGFQLGKWIAMSMRPRVEGARANPVSSSRIAIALVIFVAAIGFFVWNQETKVYPFTMLHAGILAFCVALGYQFAQKRQRWLKQGINTLAQGVSDAFAATLPPEERLKAILAVARQDDVIGSTLGIGIFIEGPDGRPIGSVKQSGDTLVDDARFAGAKPTSTQDKIDILLQEIGSALLAKFGEDVMPKRHKQNMSPRDLQNLKESSERTRAHLDATSIGWQHVNDAVFHISEARIRRGVPLAELTDMERRVRSERNV